MNEASRARKDVDPHLDAGKGDTGLGEGAGASSDTARRLLTAGRLLFSQGGFDGTSIRAITAAAGTNLGAVTYHFGSKSGLYRAVLQDVFGPIRGQIEAIADLPLPPVERIELVVRGMFRNLSRNPDLPRFFIQELVLGETPSPEILDTVRRVLCTLIQIVEEGREDGSMVVGDPVLQALTVMSQPIYLTLMPRALRRPEAIRDGLPAPEGDPEDHAVAALRRALLTREEDPA